MNVLIFTTLLHIYEGESKPEVSFIAQETAPITRLEVARTRLPAVNTGATETQKNASRIETLYALVSEEKAKKTVVTWSQYVFTETKKIPN